jgi:hypothetical protein
LAKITDPRIGSIVHSWPDRGLFKTELDRTLRTLAALTQTLATLSDLGAPPSTPSVGDCYIIDTATPSGAWSGHGNELARYEALEEGGAGWFFYPLPLGSVATVIYVSPHSFTGCWVSTKDLNGHWGPIVGE